MMSATGDEIAPEFEGFQERLESGESYESVAADAQASMGLVDDGGGSSGGGDED